MPKYLNPIDLQKYELQNATVQNLSSPPSSPATGQIYFDTADAKFKIYQGSAWVALFAPDDDFNTISASTSAEDSDVLVIYDVSAGGYRKITRGNLIAGTGGEANTGSNQGVGGVGVFIQKNGLDLEFRSINAGSSKITVIQDDINDEVDIDVDPSAISHSEITDDEAAKHRLINDSSSTSTVLWSASKISTELSGKSDTTHNHDGVYEPVDATILRQADVDDTPVNGVTTAPVSSNWAYDHANASNPHSISKSDVGLGNVTNDAQIPLTQKGAASGVAELDASGTVPSAQLPSFVDDVIEATNFAALPGTGETGKIYVTLDDNKTYRWSGSAYVEISSSLALGETSETAYRGDRGKIAYDHSQSAHAPSDAIQASGVTYENLSANGDIGTGAAQVAQGNHTHSAYTQKYATTIGDGTTTSITVTHNLGTRDVAVQLYDNGSPYEVKYPDYELTSTNSITVIFATAPTTDQYRVVVIG